MSRRRVTKRLLRKFFKRVGDVLKRPAALYITGGTTAVYLGIREGTIDVNLSGDLDELFSEIPRLKNELNVNVETAKPTDFVPPLPGEEERHLRIDSFGKATFFHFDPYSQAFSKIVRAHATDLADAKALIARGHVDPERLRELVHEVSDADFARYTRLDREAVEAAVDEFTRSLRKK